MMIRRAIAALALLIAPGLRIRPGHVAHEPSLGRSHRGVPHHGFREDIPTATGCDVTKRSYA
jgi:hypothetical protein